MRESQLYGALGFPFGGQAAGMCWCRHWLQEQRAKVKFSQIKFSFEREKSPGVCFKAVAGFGGQSYMAFRAI
jgi:hypothetical protein